MAKRKAAVSAKTASGSKNVSPASFSGIPSAAFAFFKSLAKNNHREWFLAHKPEYEALCLEPLRALTMALCPPAGAERISRIYRDVRFSKDKSPYHTHLSAILDGYYLHLSADGLYIGAGLYMPEPPVLSRLRAAIDDGDSGKQLVSLVASLRKKGYAVESHESVASVPRGFQADHPRIELLRMKDIHAGKRLDPKSLSTAGAVKSVRQVQEELTPFRMWLLSNVGMIGCAQ